MTSAPAGAPALPPVVELRQYTLRPGRRDALVELFERHLLRPQQEAGMQLIGQFLDLDRPDRFVWLRGFPGMAARAEALAAFYGGPVWAEHRDAANATMLDSDDVLLLRPVPLETARPHEDLAVDGGAPPVLTATVHLHREPVGPALLRWYADEVEPVLEAAGLPRLALLETEAAPNTFPRLPVREGEFAVVRLARARDEATLAEALRRVGASPAWAAIEERLRAGLRTAPQTLRLRPTPHSSLR